ncbi:MAG: hypothetical protein A2445_01345 [Candidatus Jacksonbacteria bacterium RIFOXYC2_FULL_44_29]|nr:MAG: hypothetical protein UW45_C0013G0033 [Parcubacteria group bacterium GW2011_GWC2_44_22]OGY76535.1 MAG: hypothetical protein A2295_02160 [Candidatus Jacksonbacteria bacterium RIFOXYB2_FULL_44_15]OGY76549.1 MAG: hypothetical protein A2240_03785 [Candidatus Jacksonbacteria bacterium RIFOXYA2_FULL_43_12]OGY78515.1 MAG: hypothetical protein A2445_01345 [Candidatus Jacksonbacteria bacterium RIFOXYC2_FULL_44_29]OGY81172.1 MAG: hypothetical protein A2550_01740 [Candidatus Jacksonbacteria bacteri
MIFTEQEVENLLELEGDVRGVAFQGVADYILKKKGADGLEQIEAKMRAWGVANFRYQEIKHMAWYPIGWGALFTLASMEVFGWEMREIREMGQNAPKVSLIVKIVFKLFHDIDKLAQQIPGFWRKHYTVGSVEVVSIDHEKKEMLIKYLDCHFHPALCRYVEGYTETVIQFTRPAGSLAKVREIQCSFKAKVDYELYRVTWT